MCCASGLVFANRGVMSRRRIFKPASSSRRLGGVLGVVGLAVAGSVLIAMALPSDLFDSTPPPQSWTAPAAEVRVVDGETLRLGARTLRLYGLDAPERGYPCRDATGQPFDCGAASAQALARLVEGRPVSCRVRGHDRYGRGLGLCEADGAELNSALVSGGWALADASALPALGPVEAAARLSGRGLWADGFEPPEAWRERRSE